MKSDATDILFQALSHNVRRRIMDLVKQTPGINLTELSTSFDISRIAIIKHLKILERALLIRSEKVGRNRRLYFNAVPIQQIYERWTSTYSAIWSERLTQFKHQVEAQERELCQKTKISSPSLSKRPSSESGKH